jgi:hypothetical protein
MSARVLGAGVRGMGTNAVGVSGVSSPGVSGVSGVGDGTLENDIITQCIDTQEEERERKEVKGKAGYREGIIVLQSRDGTAPAPQRPTVPGCARRRQGCCPRAHRVDAHISIRARQRTRRSFVRLIPVPDPMGRSSTRSSTTRQTKAESIRTRGDRLSVLLHERVTLLQQVVLQRVETPKRLFVKALALIGRLVLIKKLLARCCAALQLQKWGPDGEMR